MSQDLNVLYEDGDVIVVVKPFGADSQRDMPESIRTYLAKNGEQADVYPVHRLDRETGGLMAYAKNRNAAAYLSKQIQSGEFQKTYLALVDGKPDGAEGVLRDLLFHDRNRNKTYIADRPRKGVKEAILHYHVIRTDEKTSLLEIRLQTGRTHQIRVQFAHRGHPVVGDRKYGAKKADYLHLWSASVSFKKANGERLTFRQNAPFAKKREEPCQ